MPTRRSETLAVRQQSDIVSVRQAVRSATVGLGFSLVDQTKVVTAASELARNTVEHGGGGQVVLEELEEDRRVGLRLTFEDRGKGIPDIEQALREGYTTGGGLGLGLSGSRRLVHEFRIDSKPGEGTRVQVTRWK